MHRPFAQRVLPLAFIALTAFGCETSTTPNEPTPQPTPINEPTFTATVGVNGAVTYPFGTSLAGLVTATLATLDPNPNNNLVIGLALGTWNSNVCQVILTNDSAIAGSSIVGEAAGSGTLCARVYDVGKLTEPVTITLNITHY